MAGTFPNLGKDDIQVYQTQADVPRASPHQATANLLNTCSTARILIARMPPTFKATAAALQQISQQTLRPGSNGWHIQTSETTKKEKKTCLSKILYT